MPNLHVATTVLGDAEKIIVVPLSTITMLYTHLTLRFATWEYDPDTDEEREICCTQFAEALRTSTSTHSSKSPSCSKLSDRFPRMNVTS